MLLATIGIAPPSKAQSTAPVVNRAERCLEGNAARIAAVEANVYAAASFLVDFVCAREIERAARYERNLVYVDGARAMSRSATAQSPAGNEKSGSALDFTAKVDPETGDIVAAPQTGDAVAPMLQLTLSSMSRQSELVTGWSVPSALRARAAELVLQARAFPKVSPRP